VAIDRRDPGRTTPADEPVRSLFARISGPAAGRAPDLAAIGAALVDLATDVDYLGSWVARLGDVDGALPIHAPARGPRLMIVHRTEGNMSAVHDHGTWVAISPIVGLETHRRWRVVGGTTAAGGQSEPARLELAERLGLEPAQAATLLPPDDLHDHGHLAGNGRPAYVLILLGDDQTRFARNEWDLATGRHRVLAPGVAGRWLASEPMPRD
jgi:predicted metal-dependent enzyme (double-stranded beta helix superfamily)